MIRRRNFRTGPTKAEADAMKRTEEKDSEETRVLREKMIEDGELDSQILAACRQDSEIPGAGEIDSLTKKMAEDEEFDLLEAEDRRFRSLRARRKARKGAVSKTDTLMDEMIANGDYDAELSFQARRAAKRKAKRNLQKAKDDTMEPLPSPEYLKSRREKRREFRIERLKNRISLSGNRKWIFMSLAVIAVVALVAYFAISGTSLLPMLKSLIPGG